MSVTLAFYKGKGTWVDWLIRAWTRGAFSHVELVHGNEGHGVISVYFDQLGKCMVGPLCVSASSRDGGVRFKKIASKPGHWQLLDCPWVDAETAFDWAVGQQGKKYDYVGLIFSQLFSLRRHGKNTWFCSEFVGAALRINEPHRLSPSDLYLRCTEMNEAYARGILQHKENT